MLSLEIPYNSVKRQLTEELATHLYREGFLSFGKVERKAKMILLDENDARNIAEIYNLHKIGVIGILMRAKNRDLIKEGQAISGQSQSRGKFLDQPESL